MPRALSAVLVFTLLVSPLAHAQNAVDLKPTPQQLAWQDLEIGAIIHFGTNTFLDREWGDGTASPSVFAPTHVDTDQWMRAAASAGIHYAVLVAKHHDGFALWPTGQTSYSVKSSPWMNGKGDLVRMASDSAHRVGLGFGVYESPWDRHDPRYKDPAAYDTFYLAELEELSQYYGPLTEFWLDGAGSAGRTYNFDNIVAHLRTYQPNALVFADVDLYRNADLRWVGTESGKVDFEAWNVVDNAGYLRWRPVEADTPLHRDQWFWHPNSDATLKSTAELMEEYEATVGRGAQLMLGLAPDRTGQLPAADVARLAEFGAMVQATYGHDQNLALRHFPVPVAQQGALDGDLNTWWPVADDGTTPTLTVTLAKPTTIDRALTMERLNEGQHIEEYAIEVWENNAWKQVAYSHPIGHKKIDIFPAVTTTRVRLRILSTAGPAGIREFQLFHAATPAPPARN